MKSGLYVVRAVKDGKTQQRKLIKKIKKQILGFVYNSTFASAKYLKMSITS